MSAFRAVLPIALAALILCWSAVCHADSVRTIPSQQAIPLPKKSAPAPLNHQSGVTPPMGRILPGPQGNLKEIPLPEVFRGCWTGDVPQVDSITPLSPDAGQLIWLTKRYVLCYKQAGYNGRWKLTFAEGSVEDAGQVSDQRQTIRVKSVSGPDRAEIIAFLHFRAPQLNGFGTSTGAVNVLDELTHLHCDVIPDEDVMNVRATVFVESNGEPYANIVWHAQFFRSRAGASR
jgi:hypothetical protein